MGVGTSLLLIAVGAILRFATTVTTSGFNLQTIGVILMVIGVIGFLVSLAFWGSWGGFGGIRRSQETIRETPSGVSHTTEKEQIS